MAWQQAQWQAGDRMLQDRLTKARVNKISRREGEFSIYLRKVFCLLTIIYIFDVRDRLRVVHPKQLIEYAFVSWNRIIHGEGLV